MATSLDLTINTCQFGDNVAGQSGSALFASQGVSVYVRNSSFHYNIKVEFKGFPRLSRWLLKAMI